MNWCLATTSEKLPVSSVSTATSSARVDDGSSSSAARKTVGSSDEIAIARGTSGPALRLEIDEASFLFNAREGGGGTPARAVVVASGLGP
jgi:hypothetical protein